MAGGVRRAGRERVHDRKRRGEARAEMEMGEERKDHCGSAWREGLETHG